MTFIGGETFGLRLQWRGWLITAANWFSLPFCTKVLFSSPQRGNLQGKNKRVSTDDSWIKFKNVLLPVEFISQRPYMNLHVWHRGWAFVRPSFPVQARGYFKWINHLPDRFYRELYGESPKGICCSTAACWQRAILLKTAAAAKPAGSNSQSDVCVRTHVNGPAPFLPFGWLVCLKGTWY